MKKLRMALLCAAGLMTWSSAWGQIGDYLGPGVLSRGAGDIGTRSGAPVDLRYYFDVSGVYDTGISPFALDPKGNLITINGLYGEQVDLGAYGVHRWAHAQLGLDYKGNFYHYENNSSFDGSNHSLQLGYTYQPSRRVVYDFRALAGTSSLGYGAPGFYGTPATAGETGTATAASILFDNRIYYLEPSGDLTFLQTSRTSYTIGGQGFFIRRAAEGLASLNGYTLHGTIRHRLSKTKTVGVSYEHTHYDFPPAFGQSDMDSAQVSFSSAIGRRWAFSIAAGGTRSQVQGIQQFALNPVIAALLGTSTGEAAFYDVFLSPNGTLSLTGTFHHSSFSLYATDSISPGNGVFLTSRTETAGVSYSYTGIRKWNFGLSGGYTKLDSIGQGLQPYSGFTGGLGATYNLTHAFHIVARVDSRYQQIDVIGYNRTGYRASFGLAFSPGNVPLSLW